MTKMRFSLLSDVPRFREMPLVPTPSKDVDQATSGFFVSLRFSAITPPQTTGEEMIALLPKPQEALEETEKMIGFLESCDGLAA